MPNILVIEDEAAILDNIIEMLEVEGFNVEGAENGRLGVEKAKKSLPDLVICDVMMPELDGFGVLEALRQHSTTATIPFVFLTARSTRDDMRLGMDLGADDYIGKPFKPSELLSAINTRLDKQKTMAGKYETTLNILRKNIIYALPHELRTPLMQILGFAQLFMMDFEKVAPSDILEWGTTIYESGQRLNRMLENYLVYAQIEILQSNPEQVEALRNNIIGNPRDIIQEQAQTVAEKHGRQNDLTVELDNVGLRISKENLGKIVEELVDNAFKFSKKGTKVFVKAVREPNNYTICIRDYGRGLTAEQIRDMGAYMQFERALHEQQGLGLGLIIARRLIELHGGEMKIKSSPDKGSLICFRFSTS